MKILRIKTPEGRSFELPYNKDTQSFYEKANSRKKETEAKFEIKVVEVEDDVTVGKVVPIKTVEESVETETVEEVETTETVEENGGNAKTKNKKNVEK